MVVASLHMAEAELLAELELAVQLGVVLVQVLQEGVQSQGQQEWMRKIGVDHNNYHKDSFILLQVLTSVFCTSRTLRLQDLNKNANILGCIMAHHDEFKENPKAYATFFLKVAPFEGQVTNSRCDTSVDLYTDSLLAFEPPAAKVVSDIYMPLKTYAEALKKTSCRAPCPALSTSSATSTLSTTSSTSSKNKYKCCHKCQKMGHIRQECPYHCRAQVCFHK